MAEGGSSIVHGDGFAVGSLDDLGEGYGFRKVRRGLGVTAFGVNAVVMPPGFRSGRHFHERQEELYFVHRGRVELEFGDRETYVLDEGAFARVDPATVRRMSNVGEGDAVYVAIGGEGGYVGRDGRLPDGEESRFGQSGPPDG